MTYRTLKLALMAILMTVAPLGLAAEPLDKAELDALRTALNVGGVEVISAQTVSYTHLTLPTNREV